MILSVADRTRSDIALLYRRGGFGLRPDELDSLAAAGYDAALERLLSGLGTAPDPGGDQVARPAFNSDGRSANQQSLTQDVQALQTWWMDRMIRTSTPLREKLTLFWHGHFATAVSKVRDAKLMYLQNQLFRNSGAGSFEDLTQAVAKDGAMMVWLDTSLDKKSHPNENFAREMMELFTLGIGNYTQDDVTAGARAFTGWTYDRLGYQYVFRPGQHDYGIKTYLGQIGGWDGTDVVHIAVTRTESARFVLAKLWSHFAYPVAPSDPIISDLLPAYGAGLDVAAALGAIFRHPAFRGAASRTGLVHEPIAYLVGAARALQLTSELGRSGAVAARSLPALATALGQSPFNPPNVGGWGQNGYWLDTATASLRLNAALLLAESADLSEIENTPASARLDAVASVLGIDGWGTTTAVALKAVAGRPVQLVALALVSPEYVVA
jgi:uncharacterized protein (DUF1800 family)